jgi:general L-amino acid transport system substrate-binding protein
MKKAIISALALTALVCAPAMAGKTLDDIRKKGFLQCGVNGNLPGFSAADSQGVWRGLDVDVCRAVATAIFGDATKIKYTPLNASQRFTALQSGEVDILSRNTTWTLTRDASLGFHFAGVSFYDGQGFIVPKSLKVKSAKLLRNAPVCVQSGTTTERNLADFMRANKVPYTPVVFEEHSAAVKAYDSGRCKAFTTDVSGLASVRGNDLAKADDHVILPDVISKEPLGPVVRRGDDELFAIVKWSLNAMIEAEEYGVTSKNASSMVKETTDPAVQRLLGKTDEMGKLLGVSNDFAYNIISQVGNYGEVFETNVGKNTPLRLERGVNASWRNGGLLYAPPFR